MKVKVTEQGIVIPKEFLEGISTVEVYKEADRIVLIPTSEEERDPIWGLGSDPIRLGITDAAQNHDAYLYGLDS
ncbi:AbrB/MazE/SpoVT family DNA-binding domain-containing protein [Egbenema bharatensis]|uniref:AbrB/MazE/SpoVT family DNA-binding domain-containing protein n=1 Tax=Egbenema bharatensis TaxID=3463334 RepID=UPI003A88350E